jgi:hypothetical protein
MTLHDREDEASKDQPSDGYSGALTPAHAGRVSRDSLVELDRLAANRAIARIIARMLWEHEGRTNSGASSLSRSGPGDYPNGPK